jgi:hypothetical protein
MTLLSYLIPNLSGGVTFSGLSFLNLRGLVGLTFYVRLIAESRCRDFVTNPVN